MADKDQVKGKTKNPSVYFEEPRDVVADSALSLPQKDAILKTLEQVERRRLTQALAALEALVEASAKVSEAAREVVPVAAQNLA